MGLGEEDDVAQQRDPGLIVVLLLSVVFVRLAEKTHRGQEGGLAVVTETDDVGWKYDADSFAAPSRMSYTTRFVFRVLRHKEMLRC